MEGSKNQGRRANTHGRRAPASDRSAQCGEWIGTYKKAGIFVETREKPAAILRYCEDFYAVSDERTNFYL
jgi:hypothetical protein